MEVASFPDYLTFAQVSYMALYLIRNKIKLYHEHVSHPKGGKRSVQLMYYPNIECVAAVITENCEASGQPPKTFVLVNLHSSTFYV